MTKLRHERLCSHDITETERKIPNGETHEDYRGYRIIVGPTGDGWWARIDSLNIETMLFPAAQDALVGAMAFIDSFDPVVH
jgi:hypothetical protein